MRQLSDSVGVWIVVASLMAGILVAVAATQLATPGGGVPPLATPIPNRQDVTVDLTGGDRAAGRLAFRAQCQECHTQGRQSFDPTARERIAGIRTRTREGAGEMPAFPSGVLGDEVLLHVLTYISTPAEPEPKEAPERRIRGVNMEILEASGQPGQPAAVRFALRDDRGAAIAPGELTTLAITVGGPTIDYRWAQREDARRAQSLPDGTAQYIFTVPLPADASGTFAVGIEAALDTPSGEPGQPAVREIGFNPVRYFGVTDPVPVPRRTVVRIETCNECHGTLALHGGTRRNTELCVICHNATQSDIDKRTTARQPLPPEPVLFRNLIHRIHTGEDLAQPFTVVGGSPANPQPIDLTAVHPFPKDRANCTVCHEPGTFNITQALESETGIRVSVGGQTVRQAGPVAAACTGCHDSDRTLAHVVSQTTSGGVEACATCHGAGRPFSPVVVHRIAAER